MLMNQFASIPKKPSSFAKLLEKKTQEVMDAEAIYDSCFQQHWDKALEVIRKGARGNYQSAWGRTALHSVLFQNHIQAAPESFFQELVESCSDVINKQTESGNTALHWACTFASEKEVQILLNHGADKTKKNKEGLTALDIAIEKEDKAVIALLS